MRFTSTRSDHWNSPRRTLSEMERKHFHGPIKPMAPDNWFWRLLKDRRAS